MKKYTLLYYCSTVDNKWYWTLKKGSKELATCVEGFLDKYALIRSIRRNNFLDLNNILIREYIPYANYESD
jgi:hypothetical protein